MRKSTLLQHNLTYFWRANLAVILGVSTAVAVLAGALLVGHSVRASLQDLTMTRLGSVDHTLSSSRFFREQLASDMQIQGKIREIVRAACPIIVLDGIAVQVENGRRASGIRVYGVDDRFFQFHGVRIISSGQADRVVWVNSALARELGAVKEDPILISVAASPTVSGDSLHGRKENLAHTLRLTTRDILTARDMGDFTLRPHQGEVRAAFIPLRRLQQDLGLTGKVNTILISGRPDSQSAAGPALYKLVRQVYAIEDVGLKLRTLPGQHALALESDSVVLDDVVAKSGMETAADLRMGAQPTLTYLANAIRIGTREIPYSLVAGIDLSVLDGLETSEQPPPANERTEPPILLNEWATRELEAKPGDSVSLDYYVWRGKGQLITETAQFQLASTIKMTGLGADPDLAPQYPGITDSEGLGDWDPPFPIELRRIRPRDEEYWDRYRTAPKAFVSLEKGQELWRSRFGELTSLRIIPNKEQGLQAAGDFYRQRLRGALDPFQMGISIVPVRQLGLEASQGATDFGEYFTYFSFFLVVSAAMLAGLFFRLGVEQRLREVGTLKSLGFPSTTIRNLFLTEGFILSVIGSAMGLAGALAYAALIMFALRTWWVEAVGTTQLTLHTSSSALALGPVGGIAAAIGAIALTLHGLRTLTSRSLLAGVTGSFTTALSRRRKARAFGVFSSVCGLAILLAAALNAVSQVLAFFVAGTLSLIALLCFQWDWLAGENPRQLTGAGVAGILKLGFRNASHRPGRSILSIALIASATFIIVAVGAFRREGGQETYDKKSGNGGFPLLAESLVPIHYDPNTQAGRDSLNLGNVPNSEKLAFVPFRLKPGDDTSCLNLYRPQNPRILGASNEFIRSGRFRFKDSLAATPEDKENPWRLLETKLADGIIPAVADANSMAYVLHAKLGEDLTVFQGTGAPLRLRLVGALSDSIFQSEILISEANFLRLFSGEVGFRFFLLDLPPRDAENATATLEKALADFGFDVTSTEERLASFHKVENTYLSTFQTLGGLGLLLGTVGLAAVLLRNVLERRRELALLRAIGYRTADIGLLILAENLLLLLLGLGAGIGSAILAIAPAFMSRGGQFLLSTFLLLVAVLAAGLTVSLLATSAAIRSPLLPALREE